MKKYLEALNWLLANETIYRGKTRLPISPSLRFSIEALQRLDAIDNANPSEALECVDVLKEDGIITTLYQGKALETIRQALLKAQEQEKVLEIIKKKEVDMIHLLWCIDTYDSYINLIVYNEQVIEEEYKLTQEEFDLLKEMLNNA